MILLSLVFTLAAGAASNNSHKRNVNDDDTVPVRGNGAQRQGLA
jgi:hypothetical protein